MILWRIWLRLWRRKGGWAAPDFCPGLRFLSGFFVMVICGFAGDFCKKRGAARGFLCGKDGQVVVEVWVVSPFVGVIASLVLVIELEGRDVWADGRAGAVAEGSAGVC